MTEENREIEIVANRLTEREVTHVIFILDRSGSMSGQEADVIGGVNAYLETLRGEPGAVGVSYVRFDNRAELIWNDTPLPNAPLMTAEDYHVRGSTALLDAIGMTVAAVTPREEHTYIVIIHTDGEENASVEWTKPKVKALLEEREHAGNWTFLFFGQGVDAWSEAHDAGFSAGNVAQYAKGAARQRYASDSRMTNLMRKAKMKSTQHWAAASAAADAGASDDECIAILDGEMRAAGAMAPTSTDGATGTD